VKKSIKLQILSKRQPFRKNLSEYNYFTKKGNSFDLKRYPGDEEVLIDVEKFNLKDYINRILVPKTKKVRFF